MKKIKSKYIMIMVLVVLLIPSISLGYKYKIDTRTMVADSGFDSSYGGGGSYSSGGSSSSSSSWSSSDYSSSGSGSSSPLATAMALSIIGLTILAIIIVVIIEDIKNKNKEKKELEDRKANSIKADISDDTYNKYINIPKDEFKKKLYDDYVSIQEGWMNFDYELLRNKLTDELYNQYEMQLETLKVKNQKNIMKDFEFNYSYITDIKEENNTLTLVMILSVMQIDYIEENGNCVRGSKTKKNDMTYSLIFVKKSDKILKKCPKCGAEVTKKVSHKCEYCQTFINMDNDEWILSKKKAIKQR